MLTRRGKKTDLQSPLQKISRCTQLYRIGSRCQIGPSAPRAAGRPADTPTHCRTSTYKSRTGPSAPGVATPGDGAQGSIPGDFSWSLSEAPLVGSRPSKATEGKDGKAPTSAPGFRCRPTPTASAAAGRSRRGIRTGSYPPTGLPAIAPASSSPEIVESSPRPAAAGGHSPGPDPPPPP